MLTGLLLTFCLSQAVETPQDSLHQRWVDARASVPKEMQVGFDYLLEYMPAADRAQMDVEIVVENVVFAYRAWQQAPWKDQISEQVFLNEILPYASINERRDRWRKDFYERFQPLVAEAKSPAEAAAILNQKIFPELGVIYSTKRPKADQSPYESIDAGMASCTGLSVLLIDACRSVGVPARFVGTPLWADGSGNHSWVEVWDDGWHFTGAAEPTGMKLNQAWFTDRAELAVGSDRERAIYAVSYRPTTTELPMVWQPDADPVYAHNVTHRYAKPLIDPKETVRLRIRVRGEEGQRLHATVKVFDTDHKLLAEGGTRDDSFDANDHLTFELPRKERLFLAATVGTKTHTLSFAMPRDGSLVDFGFGDTLTWELKSLRDLLWDEFALRHRLAHPSEMENGSLTEGDLDFRFTYKTFGEEPQGGHSLFISLHGGGGAPSEVNDQQWENQKGLYEPAEGIYLAPRAPTDTWNLWHQGHIDSFLERLITNMLVFENVNPDRVYLMGYSAGGDGVYQLAPRMADRWAAAAMMAGHPNDAKTDTLYNLPFTLHVGAEDGAYDRNKIGQQWSDLLDQLSVAHPNAYLHWAKVHAGKGHWMDRDDAAAVPWMAKHTRNVTPEKIVWLQDDVLQSRMYWLKAEQPKARSRIVVSRKGNRFHIENAEGLQQITIRMDERLVDFTRDVVVVYGGKEIFHDRLSPTVGVLRKTLQERGDPAGMWSAEVTVSWEE
ncbi:MAG: hypothetical protein O3A95_02260 [Planctomycetota bacterium]|nr:hypothetical protein [Planctomycetota bacterium]MDA1113107.1 hypothetical protein [Planctomycetota bacterium]